MHAHAMGFNLPLNQIFEQPDLKKLHRTRHNIMFYNYWAAIKEPVLAALITGTLANELKSLGRDQVVERVMATLRVMYGDAVTSPLDVVVTEWHSDPHTLGSYSYLKRGSSLDDFDRLAQPLLDRGIFFAGEATSRDRFAYIDGAAVTGVREANRIWNELTPS